MRLKYNLKCFTSVGGKQVVKEITLFIKQQCIIDQLDNDYINKYIENHLSEYEIVQVEKQNIYEQKDFIFQQSKQDILPH